MTMSNCPLPLLNRFRCGDADSGPDWSTKAFRLICQAQLRLTDRSADVFQYKRDRRQVDRKCSNYDENHERHDPSRTPLSTLDMFEMGLVDLCKLVQIFAQPLNGLGKLSGLLFPSFHATTLGNQPLPRELKMSPERRLPRSTSLKAGSVEGSTRCDGLPQQCW